MPMATGLVALTLRTVQGWTDRAQRSRQCEGGGRGGGGGGGRSMGGQAAARDVAKTDGESGSRHHDEEEECGRDLELISLIGNGHHHHHHNAGRHEKLLQPPAGATANSDAAKSCGWGENCHDGKGASESNSSSGSGGSGGCGGKKSGRSVCREMCRSVHELCCGTKLCCLLPLVPFTVLAVHLHLGRGYVFAASLLAIAPLAERLGYVTEQLATFTGPTVGGLLNATFGNATELIISVLALRQNMIRVVQLSLLGSILSNMLLVLGCAFFFGGLRHSKKDQKFNKTTALVSSGLLLMSVMGLVFPAVLHSTHTEIHDGSSELALSRFTACVMLAAYLSYLYFQLKSHRDLFDCEESGGDGEKGDGGESDEEQVLGFWGSIFWLGVLTVLISILSDILVDAIQGASEMWNVPVAFISVVILPIVGNAAEHASAIMFALKDKLDISLGVAIGSSTQISMFVTPFCVVVGWICGKDMDLNFQLFETATLFITVLVVATLLQEGTSNYFKGLMLVFCYFIVSASYWVHVDNPAEPPAAAIGG